MPRHKLCSSVSLQYIHPVETVQHEKRFSLSVFRSLFVTVIGLFVQSYGVDIQCLWKDEVASLMAAFGNRGLTKLAVVDHIAPVHPILLRHRP